jgi:hypothetical protein
MQEGNDLWAGEIVYPYSRAPTLDGVPDKVGFNYDLTVRCLSAGAHNAATVMSRAVVEAIAQDKEAKGDSLPKRLKWLLDNHWLSPQLHEWAKTIKEWGDEAVHEMNSIEPETADSIVKFV